MPLYNNILFSKKRDQQKCDTSQLAPTTTNRVDGAPNASMKLLQDHLQSKRRHLQQQNPKLVKQTKPTKDCDKIISESSLHKPSENDWNPEDEYDPMLPNSYELLMLEHIKAKEQRLSQLAKQTQSSPSLSSTKNVKIPIANLLDVMDELDEVEHMTSDDSSRVKRGTLIAPPSSLSTTTTTALEEPDGGGKRNDKPNLTKGSGEKLAGVSIAEKIMSKMGYKAGQGLGKDEQGISSALEVERVGVNSGRIVSFEDQAINRAEPGPQQVSNREEPNIKKLLSDSTRILLLQNMVGPGEVDDDLEAETKEECKKYGKVVKCLIYEIPNKKVPDDQAVRIFVEFESVESSIKAVSDLDGRYFGGRTVRASFYSLERFNKFELGPEKPR